MVLVDAKAGSKVTVIGFETGPNLEGKLRQLGIQPGDCASVIRCAPWEGPFLINISGRSIALGRQIAAKIRVEENSCK